MPDTIITKRCNCCNQTKSLLEFHKDSAKFDKLRTICKICTCNHQHSRNRTEKYRQQQRLRCQNENRKQQNNQRSKRYIQKYPERVKAMTAVKTAIQNGKLERPYRQRCVICEFHRGADYHHIDYSKPLLVLPVCKICHKAIHSILSSCPFNLRYKCADG